MQAVFKIISFRRTSIRKNGSLSITNSNYKFW